MIPETGTEQHRYSPRLHGVSPANLHVFNEALPFLPMLPLYRRGRWVSRPILPSLVEQGDYYDGIQCPPDVTQNVVVCDECKNEQQHRHRAHREVQLEERWHYVPTPSLSRTIDRYTIQPKRFNVQAIDIFPPDSITITPATHNAIGRKNMI